MNPLTNILTPRARGVLYAILFVAALVFSAYQAADGDILLLIGGVITALLGATAASNASFTPTSGTVNPDGGADADEDFDWDDDEFEDAKDSFHGGTGVSGNPGTEPRWDDGLTRKSPYEGQPEPYKGEHEA